MSKCKPDCDCQIKRRPWQDFDDAEIQQIIADVARQARQDGEAEALQRIKSWLLEKSIIREQMFGIQGYVAIDANDARTVIEFREVGSKEGDN